MSSGFALDPTLFDGSRIPAAVRALNVEIEAAAAGSPLLSTYEPAAARAARAALFVHEPRRADLEVANPLAGEGRPPVGLAVFTPPPGVAARDAYLHFHGGGWVIGSAFGQNDARLQAYADAHAMAVVSVDYRLAPEA